MRIRFGGAAARAAMMVVLFAAPLAAHAQQQEFGIGIVGALTGGFAGATHDSIEGLNGWIKARGVPGKKVVLTTLDDETNPVNAQNVFRKLASDPKISVIMMFSNSNAGLAIKPFASEYKVPIISGGGADTLGVPADPYLFKVVPATKALMISVATYAKAKGYRKIAHLYSADAYGQADFANLKEAAAAQGLQEVDAESFNIDDTNFNTQLVKLKAAAPDLIYSSASGRAAVISYKLYKQMGIKIPLIISTAAITPAFFDGIGGASEADGLMGVVPVGQFGEKAGGTNAALYKELQAAIGHPPTYLATFGFDSGLIAGAGIANSDGSRQGIRDALEKLKDMPAINGLVTYRPEDHTGQDYRALRIGVLKAGLFEPVL